MFKRFSVFLKNIFHRSGGQLMVEVLVAITIGGLLLIAATSAILSVIRNNFEGRSAQISGLIAYDLVNKVKNFAASDWHNIYNLSHGATSTYYLIPGATSSAAVFGQESVLSNDVSSGLVAHWKFDETSGNTAYDSSGSGISGTMYNSPSRTSGSLCQVGSCLQFSNSANNYVNAGIAGGKLVSASAFSVSFWFLASSSMSSLQGIISKDQSSPYVFSIRRQSVGNDIEVSMSGNALDTTLVPVPGNWYHLVLTMDASGRKVYINGGKNGNPTASDGYGTPPSDNNDILYIGLDSTPGNSRGFTGIIDDVRIYNRVLSSGEISQLYNSSVYTRYFYLSNVSRTGGSIDSTYNSTNDDPSTQQVNAVVIRSDGATSGYYEYMTRFKNKVLIQNDWSGGSGQDGPITSPANYFSSSTNISAGTTLMLASSTSSGSLISSVVDTQSTLGAAIDSIIWQGNANGGTVQFQLASATSTSGPWNYIGPSGIGSYYNGVVNSSIAVTNVNNYRYIRYQIFLSPSGGNSPLVSAVILGWSQ